MNNYPTHVTVHEGHTVRVMAQTASGDYTAPTVPGTYPIHYTDSSGQPTPDGTTPYYAVIKVQIDSPERTQSSVEYFGRTLATETVPAAREVYTLLLRGYQVENGKFHDDHLSFHFEAPDAA